MTSNPILRSMQTIELCSIVRELTEATPPEGIGRETVHRIFPNVPFHTAVLGVCTLVAQELVTRISTSEIDEK